MAQDKFRELDKSEISATIAMLAAIDEKFGSEAVSVAIEAYHKASVDNIKHNPTPISERTIRNIEKKLWTDDNYGKINHETIESSKNSLRVRVTSCYYAKICQKLEEKYPRARFFGSQIYCRWNESFVKGWNEDIGFSLDRTLMDGHAFCTFYYFNKKKKVKKSE